MYEDHAINIFLNYTPNISVQETVNNIQSQMNEMISEKLQKNLTFTILSIFMTAVTYVSKGHLDEIMPVLACLSRHVITVQSSGVYLVDTLMRELFADQELEQPWVLRHSSAFFEPIDNVPL